MSDRNKHEESVDRDVMKVVRDISDAIPPKSIDTVKAAGNVAENALTAERIRRRAYEMWEADGRPAGDGQDYWVRAEQELQAAQTSDR